MSKKTPAFTKVFLILILLCLLLIGALLFGQLYLNYTQETALSGQYKARLDETAAQLTDCRAELEDALARIDTLSGDLAALTEALEARQAEDEAKEEEAPEYSDAYKAWLAAQRAVEPYDSYDSLTVAYEQLYELHTDYYLGTEKYKTAVILLVPQGQRDAVEEYLPRLERYFDQPDRNQAAELFLDDLIQAGLVSVESEDENYTNYSWYKDDVTPGKVAGKLDLTEEVAVAMLGLLQSWDWDLG